jgi:hypothetical protein
MTAGIFIYGVVVFAIVSLALGLIGWGIVHEWRDRTRLDQAREVFGEPAASLETSQGSEAAAQ